VTANVFVVASGEMDLSFPSIIGLGAMVFGMIARAGHSPGSVSSPRSPPGPLRVPERDPGHPGRPLVAGVDARDELPAAGPDHDPLGGLAIPLTQLLETPIWKIFAGTLGAFPVQLLWGSASRSSAGSCSHGIASAATSATP